MPVLLCQEKSHASLFSSDRVTTFTDTMGTGLRDFSKAFDKASPSILVDKMAKLGPDNTTGSDLAEQLFPISANKCFCISLGEGCGVLQGPALFNIFINDVKVGMFIKFVDDTLENRIRIQNYLDRLDHWAQQQNEV